ncbi:hypothetical protein [Mesonia sp.]|uniref:hypothetical protein n=1 Tax=Mesonia sp. TaxID=1960830 RepID=UPI003F9B42C0
MSQKPILAGCLFILLIISCAKEKEENPFLISEGKIGYLNTKTQLKDIDSVFKEDSIVRNLVDNGFSRRNEVLIYDKEGNILLILDPAKEFDSTSTIGNIQIKDKRYKTSEGLTVESTFKDITTHYRISRIENTLRTAVIFLDEIDSYITIDKEYIKGDARYNTDIPIEPSQIPDDAKIKHFWIGWK